MISVTGKQSGFTLTELCLVVTILGFVLVVAWPNLRNPSKTLQTQAQIDELKERLMMAREKAIYSGVVQTVILPSGKEWRVSAPEVLFFPNGKAQAAYARYCPNDQTWVEIMVTSSGELIQHKA